jgi:ribonuclease P protein component
MRLASAEVKRLLQHGQRQVAAVSGYAFSARTSAANSAQQRPDETPITAKMALTVPKRLLKRAVDRNRAKRVLRETFRQHEARLLPLDMMVMLHARPAAEKASSGKPTASQRSHARQTKQQAKQQMRKAALALFDKIQRVNNAPASPINGNKANKAAY